MKPLHNVSFMLLVFAWMFTIVAQTKLTTTLNSAKFGPLAMVPHSNVASIHILGRNRFECKKSPFETFESLNAIQSSPRLSRYLAKVFLNYATFSSWLRRRCTIDRWLSRDEAV